MGLVARILGGGQRQEPQPTESVPERPAAKEPAKKPVTVKVGRETAGRRGKGVTAVFDVPLDESGLRELAGTLKQRCGTGGTVKDGRIEIQGDQRERIVAELERLGYRVKRVGGSDDPLPVGQDRPVRAVSRHRMGRVCPRRPAAVRVPDPRREHWAGLSWETILKKRGTYRESFDQFDPVIVARYGQRKRKSLLSDAGIVRNRLKIESAIQNAKMFLAVQGELGSFDEYHLGIRRQRAKA